MPYLFTAFSFIACLILTPLVRIVAIKKGWLAQPSSERWHRKPTALLGGVAIFGGLSLSALYLADFHTILPHILRSGQTLQLPSIAAVAWLGLALLFILGLLDDFIPIKPHSKLVGEILVASLAAFLGFRLHWFTSLTIDTIVTIVWIVGITNAVNLLDNMDGLCAGVGLIASAALAFLFTPVSTEAAFLALALAAVLAAFLLYNFNPASIFMGDSGSLSIGFCLSMLSLYYAEVGTRHKLQAVVVPVLILMVPIFDTTLVTLIRLLSGRKASVGGKDHTSHRLVLMGLSERSSVLLLYGTGAVAGLAGIFVSRSDTLTSPAAIVPVVVAALLMGFYLSQLRIYPEKEFSLLRGHKYTPVLLELTYKKQLVLVSLDFCLIAFAYYLSYRLRFSGDEFVFYFKIFLQSLPAVIACKFAAFFAIGVYRGIWRYMSTNDVLTYLKSSFAGTVLAVVAITYLYRFKDFSKGIFLIDWLLMTAFLLATRGSFRFLLDVTQRRILRGDTVLIYGAGRGGEILLREILNNSRLKVKPVGFVDDDPLKAGKRLLGYPILGTSQDLPALIQKHKLHGILVSFHQPEGSDYAQLKALCREQRVYLKRFSVKLEAMDLE